MKTIETRPQLLTPAEAAAYLNVQTQTLAVWRCTGRYDIPFVRVGHNIRYRRADLDAWLERRTVTPSAIG